jgi:hypothetical protein
MKKPMPIPRSKNYDRNIDQGGDHPCLVCGKSVQPVANTWWLRLDYAGAPNVIDHDAPDGAEAEMGCWPVGNDCLKRHPKLKPYAVQFKKEVGNDAYHLAIMVCKRVLASKTIDKGTKEFATLTLRYLGVDHG